ncbi:MAG: radical SAM protein [Ignisphaera sp.]|nr:radical SAM protein [Ignisphaera sp.]MDW8084748.1 radical SAM protein [Ignisphaera sp.]
MGRILTLIEDRKRVQRELERNLPTEVVERARRDPHRRRIPRPCGITIHTSVGCSNRCVYCYIYDMGFPATVEKYPLTAEGVVYALSLNRYVAPARTLAAYGSVTEPFNPITKSFSLKLMKLVHRYLGLPSQVSTKSILNGDTVSGLAAADPRFSILVTVVTIDRARVLEPYAPSPIDRIVHAGYASRYLHTSLFIRPVIPGVTDAEIDRIIKVSVEHGVKHIVVGSLRVTRGVLSRIHGVDPQLHKDIISRLSREPRGGQITVAETDVKDRIIRSAMDYQLKIYTSACQANIDAHKEFCNMCRMGPCGNTGRVGAADEGDIAEFLEHSGIRLGGIRLSRDGVDIEMRGRIRRERIEYVKRFLEQVLRLRVEIRNR